MPKTRAPGSWTYLTRRRWTSVEAEQALEAWNQSGLELTAFAIGEGLDPQRLSRWRRRLGGAALPVFEEVLTGDPTPVAASDGAPRLRVERFEIVLSSGRVVRVPGSFDAEALRQLLAVVDEVRSC